jgi:hypothetical protein
MKFIFKVLLLVLVSSSPLYASGLMVMPSRVEMNKNNKNSEIRLVNRGSETTTYRITLQHLKMDENGIYEEIKDGSKNSGEKFVDDLVRYSPRMVTLKPGEMQTVRIMVKSLDNVEVGEYRSHILMREEPKANSAGIDVEAKTDKKDQKISVTLTPLFGVSLPVIVQVGDLQVKGSIADIGLTKDKKLISFNIVREGNASLYGDLVVKLKRNDKEYDVGSMNNISVFFPYNKRKVKINLTLPKHITLAAGDVLDVSYVAKSEDKKILAHDILTIQ